mmetsp:Transcript_19740/g.34672  ORF Transcript_19740/g.34672 Transcript_19740/m.34672 type:complete len:100 (-) Transcript_19740:1181-1480(-)
MKIAYFHTALRASKDHTTTGYEVMGRTVPNTALISLSMFHLVNSPAVGYSADSGSWFEILSCEFTPHLLNFTQFLSHLSIATLLPPFFVRFLQFVNFFT